MEIKILETLSNKPKPEEKKKNNKKIGLKIQPTQNTQINFRNIKIINKRTNKTHIYNEISF